MEASGAAASAVRFIFMGFFEERLSAAAGVPLGAAAETSVSAPWRNSSTAEGACLRFFDSCELRARSDISVVGLDARVRRVGRYQADLDLCVQGFSARNSEPQNHPKRQNE